MLVTTREKFYHPDLGRLPRKDNAGEPFRVDGRFVRELPSDATLVEATEQERAEFEDAVAERQAKIAYARAAAKVAKESPMVDALAEAMQKLASPLVQAPTALKSAPVEYPDTRDTVADIERADPRKAEATGQRPRRKTK
jgi:hypothetical protein